MRYDRLIISSAPTMDLNKNLHVTLKLEMLKVNIKDQGNHMVDSTHPGVYAC